MSRRAYEMTEADLAAIMAACRPVPAIMLHVGNPPSVQSNANAAWCELGKRMGFDGMTVEPIDGEGQRRFTAEPLAVTADPEARATHTPAPWTRVPQTQGGDLIAHPYETGDQMNPKGLRLVAFMLSRGSSLGEDEANASLIATAPKLLATVDWLRQTYHRAHHDGDLDTCEKNTCQAARDVMAEATGAKP